MSLQLPFAIVSSSIGTWGGATALGGYVRHCETPYFHSKKSHPAVPPHLFNLCACAAG